MPEIARELNVDGIVEGTFQSAASRVRVTAQFIRAATDTHLWAESYQEDGKDLFDLQMKIAASIAREIGATLKPVNGTVGLVARRPANSEAYDLYLRGRYLWNQRTPQSLEKSIVYYERALEIDPRYAKAYAALGESCVLLSVYGGPTPSEWFTSARHAAERALQLDPTLAEAHTVLAAVKVGYDWDWQAATQEYQQALKLNPNYPTAHHWYGLHLSRLGRHRDAETEIQRALDLDPLSLIINTDAGETFYWARQPDRALLILQQALELDPNFAQIHAVLGKVYEQKQNYEQALVEFKRADELLAGSPTTLAFQAHALALAGKREEAIRVTNKLEEVAKRKYVSNVTLAFVYCDHGDCRFGEGIPAAQRRNRLYRDRASLRWLPLGRSISGDVGPPPLTRELIYSRSTLPVRLDAAAPAEAGITLHTPTTFDWTVCVCCWTRRERANSRDRSSSVPSGSAGKRLFPDRFSVRPVAGPSLYVKLGPATDLDSNLVESGFRGFWRSKRQDISTMNLAAQADQIIFQFRFGFELELPSARRSSQDFTSILLGGMYRFCDAVENPPVATRWRSVFTCLSRECGEIRRVGKAVDRDP